MNQGRQFLRHFSLDYVYKRPDIVMGFFFLGVNFRRVYRALFKFRPESVRHFSAHGKVGKNKGNFRLYAGGD
jgi:hypothetical protein